MITTESFCRNRRQESTHRTSMRLSYRFESCIPFFTEKRSPGKEGKNCCRSDRDVRFRLQGFDRSMTFVVTQDPLDTTVVDFWRMIVEHGVSTIVMLSELGCSPTQTKCHPYWPVNSELICEYVKVKFVKEEANDFYIRRDFEIFNTKVSHTPSKTFLNVAWLMEPRVP